MRTWCLLAGLAVIVLAPPLLVLHRVYTELADR